MPAQGARSIVLVVVAVAGEEVAHDGGTGIASVVEARKAQARFDGLEQGEVGVEAVALQAVGAEVGVHGEQDLVGCRNDAVIVFIPEQDDGVVAFAPDGRVVDGGDDSLNRLIALVDERGVEADESAVAGGVEVAGGSGVAAAVLVVALVRGDEGKGGDVAGAEVGEEAMGAGKANHVFQIVPGIQTFLNALKVGKGIVLDGVEVNERLSFVGQRGQDFRVAGEEAVAVVDAIGAGGGQAFLIAFPAFAPGDQLVGDGLAGNVGIGRDRLDAINVDVSRRARSFVGEIDGGSGGVGSSAVDGADGWEGAVVQGRLAGREVGEAIGVVPIGAVVVQDAEVGAANGFEIVGQAGMGDGEIIARGVDALVG